MHKKKQHNVLKIFYILVLVALGLILVSPFLMPIIFAGTIALAIFPLVLKLESKGMSRQGAALLLTTFFTFVISIPFFFFLIQGTIAVTGQLEKFHDDKAYQNTGVQTIVKNIRSDLVQNVYEHTSKFEVASFLTRKSIDGYLNTVISYLLKFFQNMATNLPEVFLYSLIMILCTYTFLKNAAGIRLFFQSLFGFADARMDVLTNIFIKDSRQVYVSNFGTGGIQSLIVATTVALTGMGDFFLIFFITLILSFIPVVGAAPVAFVMAAIAWFQGNSTVAIILVGVGGFAGVVDNILRPYLSTLGESKIPPVASFIFVLGGAILLGFPGLFLGMLVGAIAFDTLPIFWEEIKDLDL